MLIAILTLFFFSLLYFTLWVSLIAIVLFDAHRYLPKLYISVGKISTLRLSPINSFRITLQAFVNKKLRPFWPEIVAAVCFFLGVLTIFWGQRHLYKGGIEFSQFVRDFYANCAAELISIAFTVYILDRAYRRKRDHEEKHRIIRQLGSQSNAFALDAVHQSRVLNLLTDGSIQSQSFKGADLSRADFQCAKLEDVDLCNATLKSSIFVKANLARSQFKDSDLENADFSNAILKGANLQRAKLQDIKGHNTDFIGADFSDANFTKASLVGANFTGTVLDRLDLTEADLTDAILKGANLQSVLSLKLVILDGTDLSEADLRGVDLGEAKMLFKPNLQRAIYDSTTRFPRTFDQARCGALGPKAQLEDADLSNLEWSSVDLTKANLQRANLSNSMLPKSTLYGTDLRNALLVNTVFTLAKYDDTTQWPESFDYTKIGAIGPGSNLPRCHLANQDLTEVDLSDAFLYKAKLQDVKLSDATLSRANLQSADLTRAELFNTDLSSADLRNANLSSAYLQRASFRSARLQGTEFRDVIGLDDADFHLAIYDNETIWPTGFDPQSFGAKLSSKNTGS